MIYVEELACSVSGGKQTDLILLYFSKVSKVTITLNLSANCMDMEFVPKAEMNRCLA